MNNIELLKDPKYYIENFTRIKGKTPGLIPFILNQAQKDLFNTLRKEFRIIILKARQIGFSSAATAWIYHKTITTPGTNSALIGYNTDMTSELLDKVKMFYQTTPASMRPTIQYNSKFEISFPKIGSKILVLPSTENVGRGYTLHNVLCTEYAMWEKAEEKMLALENSVPLDGRIIIESTPNGQGNAYHRMWMSDNDYCKKEYGWWWLYSPEEIETIRRRLNDPQKFAQEYGLEFLSSGRPVFSPQAIKDQRKSQLAVGDEYAVGDTKYKVKNVYLKHSADPLRVYKEPELDGMYAVGGDVAEGVTGGDLSVAVVLNRKTGEEVAMFRAYVAPDKFGEVLNEIGRMYNNALMAVEVNNHGLTTITILKQLLYPSMYFRPSKMEGVASGWSDKLGWKTTRVTRPLLIDDFAQATRDAILILHSKELMDEMSVFIYNDSNDMVSQPGFHDDCIFACAIAYQAFKVLYTGSLDQIDDSQHRHVAFG